MREVNLHALNIGLSPAQTLFLGDVRIGMAA